MLGWLICIIKGKHRRGVRVSASPVGVTFRCPRCGATWDRKHRAAS